MVLFNHVKEQPFWFSFFYCAFMETTSAFDIGKSISVIEEETINFTSPSSKKIERVKTKAVFLRDFFHFSE